MAIAVTSMEAVPVSNLTFYCPYRDGRWKPVTARTILGTILPLITLEGEYDEYRAPRFRGLGLIRSLSIHLDPTSTRPRPTDGQNKNARLVWHRTRSLFTVSSSTSPWCLGMAGHSQGTSLQQPPQRSTKPHLKGTPGVTASSYPIKGQAGDPTRGRRRTTDDEKKTSLHPTKEINISSNLLCTLTFSLRPRIGFLSHSL
jgi:hypothetical protein